MKKIEELRIPNLGKKLFAEVIWTYWTFFGFLLVHIYKHGWISAPYISSQPAERNLDSIVPSSELGHVG